MRPVLWLPRSPPSASSSCYFANGLSVTLVRGIGAMSRRLDAISHMDAIRLEITVENNDEQRIVEGLLPRSPMNLTLHCLKAYVAYLTGRTDFTSVSWIDNYIPMFPVRVDLTNAMLKQVLTVFLPTPDDPNLSVIVFPVNIRCDGRIPLPTSKVCQIVLGVFQDGSDVVSRWHDEVVEYGTSRLKAETIARQVHALEPTFDVDSLRVEDYVGELHQLGQVPVGRDIEFMPFEFTLRSPQLSDFMPVVRLFVDVETAWNLLSRATMEETSQVERQYVEYCEAAARLQEEWDSNIFNSS